MPSKVSEEEVRHVMVPVRRGEEVMVVPPEYLLPMHRLPKKKPSPNTVKMWFKFRKDRQTHTHTDRTKTICPDQDLGA